MIILRTEEVKEYDLIEGILEEIQITDKITLVIEFIKNSFLKKAIKGTVKNRLQGERKKRVDTLVSIFGGTIKFIIWIVAIMVILPEFGVNIAPILAGVGLMGLAVGMAAKDIIADFISGLFLLLEDHYRVGDRVNVAGMDGVVQEITLRRTILKDAEGVSHSIPNSQIKVVTKKLK